jgi:hypothetical protein
MTVARFWRHLPQRYNMVGTKCEKCGRHFFPPRTFCPDCRRAGKIVEHKFRGEGTVVTFTVIHTAAEQYPVLTPNQETRPRFSKKYTDCLLLLKFCNN